MFVSISQNHEKIFKKKFSIEHLQRGRRRRATYDIKHSSKIGSISAHILIFLTFYLASLVA